jgi:hypothetical protein
VYGLQLANMPVSDMLDVLHYFFEEDMKYPSEEEAESVSKMRTLIYREMYNMEYQYGFKKKSSTNYSSASSNNFDDLVPFDPTNAQTKPFIPATQVDPDTGMFMSEHLEPPVGY